MATAQIEKSCSDMYTIDAAMDVILMKLDEAIEDVEKGDVQTIDEVFEELGTI